MGLQGGSLGHLGAEEETKRLEGLRGETRKLGGAERERLGDLRGLRGETRKLGGPERETLGDLRGLRGKSWGSEEERLRDSGG